MVMCMVLDKWFQCGYMQASALKDQSIHNHNSKILVANSLEEYFMYIWLINKDNKKVTTCTCWSLRLLGLIRMWTKVLCYPQFVNVKDMVQAESYQRSLSSVSISQECECICGTWSYHKHYLFAITRTTLVHNETNIFSPRWEFNIVVFLFVFTCCVLCESARSA